MVLVLAFSLVLLGLGAYINPITCSDIETNIAGSNNYQAWAAEADCDAIDYCYWNSSEGKCKQDDCLKTLDDYASGTCDENCKKLIYNTNSECELVDGVNVTTSTTTGFCIRNTKSMSNFMVPSCLYDFVKTGDCPSTGCQKIPYNQSEGGVGQTIKTPICVSQPGPCEQLGTQGCLTNPDCVVLGDQCVTDICASLRTYDPETKADGECTQESPYNFRIICKEYEIYEASGRGGSGFPDPYKIEKKLKCGSRFGKYYGGYTTPDPCALLPTKFQWRSSDPNSDQHGCVAYDSTKCIQIPCNNEDASVNCTGANNLANKITGVTCQPVGDICTDGRPTTYTPPPPAECPPANAASVFGSGSVYVVLLLTAFVALLFN